MGQRNEGAWRAASRAVGFFKRVGLSVNPVEVYCTIVRVHEGSTPLDFDRLLGLDEDAFIADVLGILRHVDPVTGALSPGWHPISARRGRDGV